MSPLAPGGKILRWQPIRNPAGTLLGFFSVQTPSGMIIHSCKFMRGPADKLWVAMPARPLVQRDGSPLLSDNGRPAWETFVEFDSRDTRERFERMTFDAMRAAHPQAFDGAAEGAGP